MARGSPPDPQGWKKSLRIQSRRRVRGAKYFYPTDRELKIAAICLTCARQYQSQKRVARNPVCDCGGVLFPLSAPWKVTTIGAYRGEQVSFTCLGCQGAGRSRTRFSSWQLFGCLCDLPPINNQQHVLLLCRHCCNNNPQESLFKVILAESDPSLTYSSPVNLSWNVIPPVVQNNPFRPGRTITIDPLPGRGE